MKLHGGWKNTAIRGLLYLGVFVVGKRYIIDTVFEDQVGVYVDWFCLMLLVAGLEIMCAVSAKFEMSRGKQNVR